MTSPDTKTNASSPHAGQEPGLSAFTFAPEKTPPKLFTWITVAVTAVVAILASYRQVSSAGMPERSSNRLAQDIRMATALSTDPPPANVVCANGIDIGLRLYQNGVARKIAVEPGPATSHLRIYKDGVHGIILGALTDPNASKMTIDTPQGLRAVCLLP
jgi:hypothetical protein